MFELIGTSVKPTTANIGTSTFSDSPWPTRFNILFGNMMPFFLRCSEPTFYNCPVSTHTNSSENKYTRRPNKRHATFLFLDQLLLILIRAACVVQRSILVVRCIYWTISALYIVLLNRLGAGIDLRKLNTFTVTMEALMFSVVISAS